MINSQKRTDTDHLFSTKEKLKAICAEYHKRAVGLESIKYDLEHEVVIKDYEVNRESRAEQSQVKRNFG